MTYIKLPHTDLDDERWIDAGSDAFAVHCAAMVWCDRRLTDGRISRSMALRCALAVPLERVAEAVATLTEHGFWVEDGDGYVIVDYLEHAFPANQVKRTRERWARDKARRRQHSIGDHELCVDPKFCEVRKAELTADSTPDSTVESPGGGSRLDQTRPDSTRPDRRSGSGRGAEGDSAGATSPRRGETCPHGVTNGIFLGQCETDECTAAWQDLSSTAGVAS
ncbi:hypothetical protein [uncultured Phycicoccus sp.]|uniref:hypothetical protein n=1 Tax=uncultured Phycicoccus sp. TaxID=661422 RepID=UPI002618364D|nr:hypothetical protein [uncultured Phycicoccus sp.]